jgi:hypothetical protein
VTRIFGGVKVTARRVLPGESIHRGVPATEWAERHPQARPRNGPHPEALDYAAWYLAGVLCEQNGHDHPYGQWPCKQSLGFALTEMHRLADHKFTPVTEEKPRENTEKRRKKPGGNPGKRPGRKSGGKRHPVR